MTEIMLGRHLKKFNLPIAWLRNKANVFVDFVVLGFSGFA